MRNVIAALAISIGASVILYSAATALGLPSEVAKGLAGLPAFATKNVYEFLEASSARRNLAQVGSESIASLDQFSISPLFVFFLASVMFSGAMIVSGALMGGLFGIAYAVADRPIDPRGADASLFAFLVVYSSFPIRILAAVYVGRWIGARSASYGSIISAISIFVGACIAFVWGITLINDEALQQIFGHGRDIGTMIAAFGTVIPDIIIYIISGIIGVWFGRRQRLSRYLSFVLGLLPGETRSTIVEMARDEAVRAQRGIRAA